MKKAYLAIFSLLLIYGISACADESVSSLGNEALTEILANPKKKKDTKPKFKGYGPYRPTFKEICRYIVLDGRDEIFFELLKANNVKDPQCFPCKALINTWFTSCKDYDPFRLVKKGAKKVEPTPTPPPPEEPEEEEDEEEEEEGEKPPPTPTHRPYKQRDPSSQILDLISAMYRDIRDQKLTLKEHYKALSKLKKIFSDKDKLTVAELEYFDTVFHYASAPFESMREELEREDPKPGEVKTKEQLEKEHLDRLFGS